MHQRAQITDRLSLAVPPCLLPSLGRAGFSVLGALVTLHELSVANTAVGDASLATWGALTQLTRLNLDCTAVTNTCAPRKYIRCQSLQHQSPM